MINEKDMIKKKLVAHHQRRPTIEDLQNKGIVPTDYFTNPMKIMRKQHSRKVSMSTELAKLFKTRPDVASVVKKGLIKAEFIDYRTHEEAERKIDTDKEMIKTSLINKLDKRIRPSKSELEERGIVPMEYFKNPVK